MKAEIVEALREVIALLELDQPEAAYRQLNSFLDSSLVERNSAEEAKILDLMALVLYEQGKLYDSMPLLKESLLIRERLSTVEPNRADYQRDLSVSYERMGDLLRALGQGEQAKTFYEKSLRIRERLAADEPNRADYQTDLAVLLVRVAGVEPENGGAMLLRALSILETLRASGALLPIHEPWLDAIRRMLEPL